MNNDRRKTISRIVADLEKLRKESSEAISTLTSNLENLKEDITDVRNDEQEAFDNLPEGLQSSEKGSSMEEGISAIDGCADATEELLDVLKNLDDTFDDIIEKLKTATE